MKSAKNAILLVPKKDRGALREPMSSWTRSFIFAVTQRSVTWALSLGQLATTRAENIEARIAAIKSAHWKTLIGAKAEEGSSRKPTPTRVAYMYLRTPIGWHPSPVGKREHQDKIADAPDQHDSDTDVDDNTFEEAVFDDAAPFVPQESPNECVPLADQAAVEH